MVSSVFTATSDKVTPIILQDTESFETWLEGQSGYLKKWIATSGFEATHQAILRIPNPEGELEKILVTYNPKKETIWLLGHLAQSLPAGDYKLVLSANLDRKALLLGWALGSYRYTQFKGEGTEAFNHKPSPRLLVEDWDKQSELKSLVDAITLVRDLINCPANVLGPEKLEEEARKVAKTHGARLDVIIGEKLLKQGFGGIYAVGKASAQEPRLMDLKWGDPKHPKLTLVGKGVCFDSGGLDIKPTSGMRLMKKDMGGAALVLGLAQVIMSLKLPISLRVLIPAVENAVSGNAMRPGDIYTTYSGKTVEIGNTDAEGRLILCDALALGAEDHPDLMIDCATLTGAARVALGPDLPAVFSNQDQIGKALVALSHRIEDPLWQLPLWRPYADSMKSKNADLDNDGSMTSAGAITAALFMDAFVKDTIPWIHIDTIAWNATTRPGRPEGGEAMGLRALYTYIRDEFLRDKGSKPSA